MIERVRQFPSSAGRRVVFSGAYVKSLNGILKRTPHNSKNGGFSGFFGGWRVSFENRILRPIKGLRYTCRPSRIIRVRWNDPRHPQARESFGAVPAVPPVVPGAGQPENHQPCYGHHGQYLHPAPATTARTPVDLRTSQPATASAELGIPRKR